MAATKTDLSAIERVASALRQEITSGVLEPGTRLRDHELAERYQVSRNTLRDAVRRLEVAGLVDFRRNAGGTVRTMNASDIKEIFAVRRALELSGVRASATATAAQIAAMNTAVDAVSLEAQDELPVTRASGLAFHKAVVAFNDSEQIDRFFDNVLAQMRLAFNWLPMPPGEAAAWHARDRAIADQIIKGQQEEAVAALAEYLNDSEARLINVLSAQTKAGFAAGTDSRVPVFSSLT